jgi:Domain of unknown function (DUF1707)
LGRSDALSSAVRASDEDRERVVAALKAHCAAGRLTLDELPGRVEHAYAAATLAELEELTRDLPGRQRDPAKAADTRGGKLPRMPGTAPFTETIEFDRPTSEVETEALRAIAPRLARYGFSLVTSERRVLVFVRTGMMLRTHRVQLTLHELDGNRTRMTVHGSAPLGIRRAFAQLRS